ncbi:MAG: precorrin-8X methylmutase [Bacillota bacterium]|nr:precorrin-8X methylmutase [Bacillota bacterium]
MNNYEYTKPADIEKESMRIIEGELNERGLIIPDENLTVVKRVIHTTADFDYAENLRFTEGAVSRVVSALQSGDAGLTFITDTNMALSGISKPSLAKLGASALCYMADENIMQEAKAAGTTRAYASMKRGASEYPNGIFVSGNAPTALIAISELIRDGLRPSLVIGVPVGFVNVVESKEELFALCEEKDIPAIVAFGRKGGSNVAASICNALLYSAVGTIDPLKRGWQK